MCSLFLLIRNFASWNGVLDDGRLSCEWVVSFYIDNHYDGTATIYVKSIDTPEDYGIAQYNQNKKNNVDKVDETQKKSLTNYEIKNNTLSVTYDGGEKYINVPDRRLPMSGQYVAKVVMNNIIQALAKPENAAMVSILLVVLCADEPAQPVINSGTLNH